jgi:redox-sensitive bicupin YhaK (pirin superfamily)
MTRRAIASLDTARPTLEGAGVRLSRAIGSGDPHACDPFLLLDDFRSEEPRDYLAGFPWHPHRGIETITYVLEGDVEHEDSLGNKGVISSGEMQWMTAGSGIVHQEMPKGSSQGVMHGFQLWANLPASHKMTEPRYRDVRADQVPVIEREDGSVVRVLCGIVEGVEGPVQDIVAEPEYLDVTLPPHAAFVHPTERGATVIAYVIEGTGRFGPIEDDMGPSGTLPEPPMLGDRTLVRYSDGDEIGVSAGDAGVRFLLISGRPIGEDIAWRGPIVMNTQEELREAYRELRDGTFIKNSAPTGGAPDDAAES